MARERRSPRPREEHPCGRLEDIERENLLPHATSALRKEAPPRRTPSSSHGKTLGSRRRGLDGHPRPHEEAPWERRPTPRPGLEVRCQAEHLPALRGLVPRGSVTRGLLREGAPAVPMPPGSPLCCGSIWPRGRASAESCPRRLASRPARWLAPAGRLSEDGGVTRGIAVVPGRQEEDSPRERHRGFPRRRLAHPTRWAATQETPRTLWGDPGRGRRGWRAGHGGSEPRSGDENRPPPLALFACVSGDFIGSVEP